MVRMQRMCYYIRTESCRPEFGSLQLEAERTGWFGCVSAARERGAVGAEGSPGTGSASLSKQVCRSQQRAALAALRGKFAPGLPALAGAVIIPLLYVSLLNDCLISARFLPL